MRRSQLTFLILVLFIYHGYSQVGVPYMNTFQSTTGARVSLHRATGVPGFIRFPQQQPMLLSGASIRDKGDSFLVTHGRLFGENAVEELRLESTAEDLMGHEHMTYQQRHLGVPVYGALMRFHFDPLQRLKAINGVYVDEIKTSPVPALSSSDAATIALSEYPGANLEVHKNALCFYRSGLAQGVEGPTYLVYEVVVTNHADVREFLFIDAHRGDIVDRFSGIHGGLNRKVYEGSVSPGNLVWEEGDQFPGSLDIWERNSIITSEQTYYFFLHTFGFESFDNMGAEMIVLNNASFFNSPNASWNGTSTNFYAETASDDVITHEWGHAYTDYTSDLIYAWQAGALNESYSDIWGETIDLLNGYEDGDESLAIRTGCSSSDRWRMGEDASAFGGAIRDMWNPTCNGDPGKVSDPQYYCSSGDNGGVHSNSGVNNHAYALLVDGGSYNGYTINGIGFTKAAHIFWRAQRFYLTPTSNFSDQADALEASCTDLMGINLEGLSTTSTPAGPSGEIINTADLEELQKVLAAVEMRMAPPCNFTPLLSDPDTILCAEAIPQYAIFYEDFETGLDGWTVSEIPTNPGTWEDREWVVENSLPDGRPGNAAFATDPVNGNCSDDLQNGILRLESPEITVSVEGSDDIMMSFYHYVATEYQWDGGNIKYNLNGAGWELLPHSSFEQNNYTSLLNTEPANDNPLEGEWAFTGTDGGSVSGSWAQSIVNLSSLGVGDGSTIQFRFELGTDGCNGRVGWYVDDISIYQCADCISDLNLATELENVEAIFSASGSINTSDTLSGDAHIIYDAADHIELSNGFEVGDGAELTIRTEGCDPPLDK